MIQQCINFYNLWTIVIYYDISLENFKVIEPILEALNISKEEIDYIKDIILLDYNNGVTCSDIENKFSITCIGQATTDKELLNTIIHELKHIQSAICKVNNIDEDSEGAAYIIGDLTSTIYKVFVKLIANTTRNN